jgi:hypothetical protein
MCFLILPPRHQYTVREAGGTSSTVEPALPRTCGNNVPVQKMFLKTQYYLVVLMSVKCWSTGTVEKVPVAGSTNSTSPHDRTSYFVVV